MVNVVDGDCGVGVIAQRCHHHAEAGTSQEAKVITLARVGDRAGNPSSRPSCSQYPT
jgi:hypothetical protein